MKIVLSRNEYQNIMSKIKTLGNAQYIKKMNSWSKAAEVTGDSIVFTLSDNAFEDITNLMYRNDSLLSKAANLENMGFNDIVELKNPAIKFINDIKAVFR